MPTLGIDFSGAVPRASAIKAAGYQFVVRYLSSGGSSLPGKLLTATEYQDLLVHGIMVAVNWETTADRMLSGFSGGVDDAKAAEESIAVIGYPSYRPVYFSADYDFAPSDQPAIDAYLNGATSILSKAGIRRTGLYGDYYVIERCLASGSATWFWQASAWSGGQIHPSAHMLQHIQTDQVDGVWCDVNEALIFPDFGQHPSLTNLELLVPWRLDETKAPLLAKVGVAPDGTWAAKEDTITLPGAISSARVSFGFGGAWIQEAWWGPTGAHIVLPSSTIAPGGLAVPQFDTLTWTIPSGADKLVIRYSAPSGGSIAFTS